MKIYSGNITKDIIHKIEVSLRENELNHHFYLSEYNFFDKNLHIQHLISQLNANPQSFCVFIEDKNYKKACAIISISDFDSLIFGFKVASIDYLMVSESFKPGIRELFSKILEIANKESIQYINFAINTNDPSCADFLNIATAFEFYFINTLVVFSTTKDKFHKLDLSYPTNPDILIRDSKEDDFLQLSAIAKNSFKLDKYHLDNNLPKKKCDDLYAESFFNSFYNGFVDKILVAEYRGIPIGYSTIKIKELMDLKIKVGFPVIAAVSENYRGIGAYQALEKERIIRINQVTDVAEYGTYINNHPVHSIFIKNKMRMTKGLIQMAFFNNLMN